MIFQLVIWLAYSRPVVVASNGIVLIEARGGGKTVGRGCR